MIAIYEEKEAAFTCLQGKSHCNNDFFSKSKNNISRIKFGI